MVHGDEINDDSSDYDRASNDDDKSYESIASQQFLHSDEVDEDEPNEKLESQVNVTQEALIQV